MGKLTINAIFNSYFDITRGYPPFFFVAIHSGPTLPAASDTQLFACRVGDVAQGGGRMDALAQDEACHVRIP